MRNVFDSQHGRYTEDDKSVSLRVGRFSWGFHRETIAMFW